MKLIYLTSKKYPSRKTDPFYVQSMATAFAALLGKNFIFLVRGSFPEEFQKLNTSSIPAPRRFRTIFYFFALPAVVLVNGWYRRDFVFLSYDPNLLSILIFWRALLRFRYRVVSDWHQLFDDWRDSYVARRSDMLVATSERLKSMISSRCGVSAGKIRVAYGGVDPRPFRVQAKTSIQQLRKELSLPEESFLVGYVGSFTSIGNKKGIDTMIEALLLLPNRMLMVFVGGSEQEIEEYQAFAKRQGVLDRSVFVRKQLFEGVVKYERAMDILVIPYPDKPHFRDYGFPMKVWEYLASGRPIIYSNLAIMGEILKQRGASFIPGDSVDLARTITAVHTDWKAAEEAALKNTADVEAYTWAARADGILKVIEVTEHV